MSERRKKDRYNETWTKEELTSSLKKSSDKRSSHRSGKHREDDEIYSKKDKRSDRHERHEDEYGHKSRSSKHREHDEDRHQRRERHSEKRDDRREREHRDRVKERPPSHDRRKERNHDKEKYHEANGDTKVRSREKHDQDSRHRDKKSERRSGKHDEERNQTREEREHYEGRKRRKEKRRDEDEYDERRRDKKRDERTAHHDDDYREKHRKHRDEGEREKEHHRKTHDRKDRSGSGRVHEDTEPSRRERRHRRDEREERSGRGYADEDPDHHERSERKHKKHKEDIQDYDRHSSGRRRDEDDSSHSRKKHRDKDERGHDREKDNREHGRSSHRHQSDAQGSSSKQSESHTEHADNRKQEEEEYNYDDEEFEDYDDDFEDDDDNDSNGLSPTQLSQKPPAVSSELEELRRAIAAENQRANSAHTSSRSRASDRGSPYSVSSSIEDRGEDNSSLTSAAPAPMISFKARSAQSRAMTKVLKRRKDLANLIQLDTVSFDIVDMAPVTEYNLYIKNFGNSNTSQASTQCNDDDLDQEVQTDIPEVLDKWSQHPPHDIKCVGGGETANVEEESRNEQKERMLSMMRSDSKRLGSFMSRACKLIESVLIEDELWGRIAQDGNRRSQLSICDGYLSLETNLAYLQGRKVVHVECSPESDVNLIAVAFEPASKSFSTRIDRKGVIVVWDTRKPTIPEKLLVCDTHPTCCCFSPKLSHILFVGTGDGCVLAYDLREPGTYHQIVSLEKTRETILRSPTYSTGFTAGGHTSPIVTLMLVGSEAKVIQEDGVGLAHSQSSTKPVQTGLAFQVASLEESATVCIWVVVEMADNTGFDGDNGLAPHGKIKLIRSLSIQVEPPVKTHVAELPFRATSVQFSVTNPNHFYVGTDTGHIVHCTQYSASSQGTSGSKPKGYFIYYNELNTVSAVTDISINPFQCFGASLILAGFHDGTLRLYLTDREMPVITWPFSTDGLSVFRVQWSTSRPSVFFVLDSAGRLHIWDLAIMDSGPIKTEGSSGKKITHFSLSNASESSKRLPEIALIYEAGSEGSPSAAEVHKLAAHFSHITDTDEMDRLNALLQSML